jgi:anaerobic ribonucleoside-triphosphate reductase
MNHNVEIISRVTGYLSIVSGRNEAKKQEFEDRQRYDAR